MYPIFLLRKAARESSLAFSRLMPRTFMVPEDGFSRPATKFRRVVSPAPEGPRTIAVCARASVKVMASRALMMLPFAEYSLETLARSTAFSESALGDLLDSSTWLVPIVKSGHRSKGLYELVNNQRTSNAKVLRGPSWTVRLVAASFASKERWDTCRRDCGKWGLLVLEESSDRPYLDAYASDNSHPKSDGCDDNKGCTSIVRASYCGLASSID